MGTLLCKLVGTCCTDPSSTSVRLVSIQYNQSYPPDAPVIRASRPWISFSDISVKYLATAKGHPCAVMR